MAELMVETMAELTAGSMAEVKVEWMADKSVGKMVEWMVDTTVAMKVAWLAGAMADLKELCHSESQRSMRIQHSVVIILLQNTCPLHAR